MLLAACGIFLTIAAARFTVFDDEAFSCRRYVMPLGDMVAGLRRGIEPDPPLYYIAEGLWIRVVGVAPLALRSLSIAFFLTGLVFIRLAGTTWFDVQTGRAAMFLAALHPAHLLFGMAARWYSLMFMLGCALLYLTGRLAVGGPRSRRPWIAWVLVATALLYTNYFSPVLVGLAWIALQWKRLARDGSLRRANLTASLIALAAVAILFAPWAGAYWRELHAFPTAARTPAGYFSTAGRTVLPLLTGNWASPRAWWAWGPCALFGIVLAILLARRGRTVGPLAAIVVGCLVAGIASLGMKDKYVMTFSGPACVLAGGLLVDGWRRRARTADGVMARVAAAALVAGWLGCYANLTTQRYWSSLRWLDPMQEVVQETLRRADDLNAPVMATHPSVRYYAACARASGEAANRLRATRRIIDRDWAAADGAPHGGNERGRPSGVVEPREFLSSPGEMPKALMTIETAEFSDSAAWRSAREFLQRNYRMESMHRFLPDVDAALKDRMDPAFSHPAWRIVTREWRQSTP